TPLFGFGPIDPINGFPQYYQDSNGLALQQCVDLACDPALAIPDPTRPISFPDNFPVELFYSRAISTITVGTIKAVLNDQFEGSFANGAVALPGDQVVFGRVRVRIFGGTPGGTYTVTHPYGVEVLQADAVGTVNFTQDSARIPAGPARPAPTTPASVAAPATAPPRAWGAPRTRSPATTAAPAPRRTPVRAASASAARRPTASTATCARPTRATR